MDPDQHTFINFITKIPPSKAGDSSQVEILLGITGISWYGRNLAVIEELCAVLVSKLACLKDSDCLLDYPELRLAIAVKIFSGRIEFWFGMIRLSPFLP